MSSRARSGRSWHRDCRRTRPRGSASTSTAWPGRGRANGSATPVSSPPTCRRGWPSPGVGWRRSPSDSRPTSGSGSGSAEPAQAATAPPSDARRRARVRSGRRVDRSATRRGRAAAAPASGLARAGPRGTRRRTSRTLRVGGGRCPGPSRRQGRCIRAWRDPDRAGAGRCGGRRSQRRDDGRGARAA